MSGDLSRAVLFRSEVFIWMISVLEKETKKGTKGNTLGRVEFNGAAERKPVVQSLHWCMDS